MDVAPIGKRLDEREVAHREAHGIDRGLDGPRAPRERHMRPVDTLLGAKAPLHELGPEPLFELTSRGAQQLLQRDEYVRAVLGEHR